MLSSDKFGGLKPIFYLNVGAKIMVTRNSKTKYNLCNDALTAVKALIYKGDQCPLFSGYYNSQISRTDYYK